NLANGMAASGVDVALIVATDRGAYWNEVSPDVRLIRLGARRALFGTWRFVRLVRRERPDAVLSTLKASNVALAVLKVLILRRVPIAIREASIYRKPQSKADFLYD